MGRSPARALALASAPPAPALQSRAERTHLHHGLGRRADRLRARGCVRVGAGARGGVGVERVDGLADRARLAQPAGASRRAARPERAAAAVRPAHERHGAPEERRGAQHERVQLLVADARLLRQGALEAAAERVQPSL